jgi:valyl-tRNA synthetase
VEERWILHRVSETAGRIGSHLDAFRFDLAANELYQFFWADFCDWYIELAKPALQPGAGPAPGRRQVGDVLLTVLDRALRLLHPFMPFLTEELWQRLPGHELVERRSICLAPFPAAVDAWQDPAAAVAIANHTGRVTAVRNVRTARKLPPKAKATLVLEAMPEALAALDVAGHLGALAGVERLLVGETASAWDGLVPQSAARFALLTAGPAEADGAAASARRSADLEQLEEQILRAEANLADPGFTAKAPPAVVEGRRRRLAELLEQRARLGGGVPTR